MKKSKVLVFGFLFLVMANSAFASGNRRAKPCEYNEFHGELVRLYETDSPEKTAGFAPMSLALCEDSKGRYIVYSYKAVGLGELFDIPLPVVNPEFDSGRNEVAVFTHNDDEFYISRYLDTHPGVQVLGVIDGSKDEIVVYRRQLSRVISATLYLVK